MAKRQRPAVPAAALPRVAPPPAEPRRTRADTRHSHAARVRSAVRRQLAHSQRRRQELSRALSILRRDLREFRNQVRTRLREISHAAATRRATSAKTPPPPAPAPSPSSPNRESQ